MFAQSGYLFCVCFLTLTIQLGPGGSVLHCSDRDLKVAGSFLAQRQLLGVWDSTLSLTLAELYYLNMPCSGGLFYLISQCRNQISNEGVL